MASLTSLPGRLDLTLYVSRSATITLAWPAGSLVGRTFSAALVRDLGVSSVALTLSVVGDLMTITVPAAAVSTISQWSGSLTITETTAGMSQPMIVGSVRVVDTPGVSSTSAIVQLLSTSVAVSVSLPGVVQSVNGISAAAVVLGAADVGAVAVLNERLSFLDSRVGGVAETSTGPAQDTAMAAALALMQNGGELFFPPGYYRLDNQRTLPNDGAAIPTQKAMRWVGAGGHFAGRQMDPSGGPILDLRYAGAGAKIRTLGVGSLEIAGITFADNGASTSPFILTTNTTLHVHDCAFNGNLTKIRETCDQDALVFGGTTTTIDGTENAPFQGYGSVIERNYFNRIRRGIYGRAYFNGVPILNNTWWATCGSDGSAAAIESDGFSQSEANTGLYVAGNLVECVGYVQAIKCQRTVNSYFANSLYDVDASLLSFYLFGTDAVYNTIMDVYRPDSRPLLIETGNAVDTTTVFTSHQSQVSIMPQPWRFTNLGAGVVFDGQATFAGGIGKTLVQPAAAQANDNVELLKVKRSAAEGVNPGADVMIVTQAGKLILSGDQGGSVDFEDEAGTLVAQFAAGLKTWKAAGAGGNMLIDSGSGGSYITFRGFGVKLLDYLGTNTVTFRCGTGSPEGAFAAPVGSVWLRVDGGANTTLYVKESGTGNTGWVAK